MTHLFFMCLKIPDMIFVKFSAFFGFYCLIIMNIQNFELIDALIVKKMSQKHEAHRKLICVFARENPNLSKSRVANHFSGLKISRSTVYRVLRHNISTYNGERKGGSGRKSTLNCSKERACLKRATAGRIAKSFNELGKKFKCDPKTVKKTLNNMKVVKKSRKAKPATSLTQVKTQKSRLKKLVANTFHVKNDAICLMDDETYFTMDGNEWQGNHYFDYPSIEISSKIKHIEHSKFPKKVMLWLCISERGMSEPQFFEAGLAVNAERYKKYCLQKVAKFIESHHKNIKTVFWPDLASCHYAKASLAEMDRLKIAFVPKEENPPNTPQLRPIEDFWANLKRRVYGNNYRPKSVKKTYSENPFRAKTVSNIILQDGHVESASELSQSKSNWS